MSKLAIICIFKGILFLENKENLTKTQRSKNLHKIDCVKNSS